MPQSTKITNVLLVFANPQDSDQLRLGAEERVIRESIRRSANRDNIALKSLTAATPHDLRRALLDENFDVVQISGHGSGRGLLFEDERGAVHLLRQEVLADLFEPYTDTLKCVVLNACYSVSQGELISLGIPFTVAMENAISDHSAIEFSRGFYDAIGAGRDFDFAYEEGWRSVKISNLGPAFNARLLRKDEKYVSPAASAEISAQTRGMEPIQFKDVSALIGVAIDLSGSMAQSIRNDTETKVSRLESVRQSLGRLANQAREGLNTNRRSKTTIELFGYGFGFREIEVADLLALIKVGPTVISKQEIDNLKNRYTEEMKAKYRGYEGTGQLMRGLGFGNLVDGFTSTMRANAEAEIRHKIMLEIKDRLIDQLKETGEITLTIEQVTDLWTKSGDTLANAEELIYGNTPMNAAFNKISARFEHELRTREKGTIPLLLVVSDGEPTDGDPTPVSNGMKKNGVTIVSCFVTETDVANPRILYGEPLSDWNNGARLMYEMASPIKEDSQILRFLLEKGWSIQPNPRLFVQLNHSVILDEFVRVLFGPLEADRSRLLPRGI